ncbi:MAG: hypothetical protein ACAI34_01555 [Verrucomicrobium sp.]
MTDSKAPELFHDYPVLGKMETPTTAETLAIVSDLDKSGKRWSGAVFACFSPRHGVRAVVNGSTHDLLICYECASAEIYKDSEQVGTVFLSSDHYDQRQNQRFNAILISTGIQTDLQPRNKPSDHESKQ